jgi:hypothetical protein
MIVLNKTPNIVAPSISEGPSRCCQTILGPVLPCCAVDAADALSQSCYLLDVRSLSSALTACKMDPVVGCRLPRHVPVSSSECFAATTPHCQHDDILDLSYRLSAINDMYRIATVQIQPRLPLFITIFTSTHRHSGCLDNHGNLTNASWCQPCVSVYLCDVARDAPGRSL